MSTARHGSDKPTGKTNSEPDGGGNEESNGEPGGEPSRKSAREPDGTLPLAGYRILDLTSAVVGPYATQILADYGAEVVKLEQPSGDIIRWISGRSRTPGMSGKFMHMNRNKRSIALNLKADNAREAALRLVRGCNVFVHNMRSEAIARLGLTFADLEAVNPEIVYCNIVGFGTSGPYADRPAYDSILQGGTGLAGLFAAQGGEPRYVPYVVVDRTAALMVVNAILVALLSHGRRGGAREIEVPMFESYASLVLSEHLYGETFEPAIGTSGDKRLLDANARPVKTRDGYICITTNTDAQVLALFDAMGRPDLKGDTRFNNAVGRIDHIAEFFQVRADEIARHDTAYWQRALADHDIPAMPCHSIDTLLSDPHIVDVGLVERVRHPSQGTIKNIKVPVTMTGYEPSLRHHAPLIGEQTEEILRELGFDETHIRRMLSDGDACIPASTESP
jgi:crotonobetainyl-CoA:carnitine CoA-transferase CaiB-like acyl-CoA transferase